MFELEILDKCLSEIYEGQFNSVIDGNDIYGLFPHIAIAAINDNYPIEVNGDIVKKLITISNLLYNNTPLERLPLEDGVYDLLMEKYMSIDPNFNVGSIPVFIKTNLDNNKDSVYKIEPFRIVDKDNIVFESLFTGSTRYINREKINPFISIKEEDKSISKRLNISPHNYPELVGTLTKCKFVTIQEAKDKGVENDSNVRILERDFFHKHFEMNLINNYDPISIVVELKYDGVSIEADVSNRIISAGTRGDIESGVASDLTPIFKDYIFPNAVNIIPDNNTFGMKFEAIMTNEDLLRFNALTNKTYKNCRTAIIGLLGNSDAYKYRDFITLVPLSTSLNIGREEEIEFINRYYAIKEKLRYSIINGNYMMVLYGIKKFVEEAELYRPYAPFMYDGVVISYKDKRFRNILGRSNGINHWSTAVKFNSLSKFTKFRRYTYTVGQDGSITPMIHYDPVEFFGTIHNKSTGHSYERFNTLNLSIGDTIRVEYVNDVMPYVYPTDFDSIDRPVLFIDRCPECGTELKVSSSGKMIYCNNMNCKGRLTARATNMLKKLNVKDFAESTIKELNKYTLSELLNLTKEDLERTSLGPKTRENFLIQMNKLKIEPILDYTLMGSLGFDGISSGIWKKILSKMSISKLYDLYIKEYVYLYSELLEIKGIGDSIAQTIIDEFDYFEKDIIYILKMTNVIHSINNKSLKIRFTGVRDTELVEDLSKMGIDIGEGSVTKDTNILIIPYDGYSSNKVNTAIKYGCKILSLDKFRSEIHNYL